MNEIELLIPGEFRLHLRLPFNMMELLDNLEQNNPMLINAFDDQDRNLLIECIRVEDLITMRVVNDNREYISDAESNGWTCSVSDIMAQLNPISSPTTEMIACPDDDFMTSVVIKEEQNHEESESALILSMVNEYMEPEESCTLVQLSEEQPAEEIIFGNNCKVLAYSTSEPSASVDEDSGNSENYYIQIHPADLESLADGSNIIISHMGQHSRELVDDRQMEVGVGSGDEIHRPRIVSDLLVFRCSLCSYQFLKEETAKRHLRWFHPHSDAVLHTEVAGTTYICTVCSQPFWDDYRWRLHMKHVHGITTDHQQKSHSKVETHHRKRISWFNRKSVPIECLICQTKMVLFESYYLHIRKQHRSHSLYKTAMKHLLQVREKRLRRKCKMSLQCSKCQEMFTEYSIISHLRVMHADDPCINEMIASTKLSTEKMMKSLSAARAKVNVRCQFCEKDMATGVLKSHLEFHCPALNAVVPDGEIKQEVHENVAKNGVETVLVRMPRTTVCEQCNKVMTLKSFYHHQRRVHGIGLNNAKMYSCSYCKKPFWDQYHLQNHLLTHTRDRAFVCLVCRRSFINLVSYTEHHRKVHERQFLHSCSTCGRGFWKRVDKLRHNCKPQNLCLNQLRNARLTAKAKATMEKWVGPFYLEMDRREAEKITTGKNKSADRKGKQNSLQGEKKLVCIVCKKSFQSIRYFQSHFRYSHLQDYDLICERCGLGFWNTTQMTSHKCEPSRRGFNEKKRHLLATRAKEMLRNIPKPYYYVLGMAEQSLDYPELIKIDMERNAPCDEDSSAAPMAHDSEVMENAHFANKDEQSDIAGTLNQELNVIGTTSSEEPNKADEGSVDSSQLTEVQPGYCLCSICGKEIKVKNYYPHMRRVHCDDSHKPIVWKVCDQCGYRCQDNYKFRRHCMTHNKQKGIPCELCNRLSYEVIDYNQHFKRRHLGQFNIRCNDCGKGFWKMNALQAHTCYPELKEENLQMQKRKEEEAVKKRDAVRKATGINSNIDEENAKQHSNQKKTGAKENTAKDRLSTEAIRKEEHNAENGSDRCEEITSQPPKQRKRCQPRKSQKFLTSSEPNFCSESSNTILATERNDLVVDSQLHKGMETVAAGKMTEQQRTAGMMMAEGRNEIKTNVKETSSENKVTKQQVAPPPDCVSPNGEETAQKRCKLEITVDKKQYSCMIEELNERIHKYGTRKKQVSFRALLGKK